MDGYLTKKAAVRLIVGRVKKPGYEVGRAWRNKINKRIGDDVKNGKIHPNNNGLLNRDDVLRHARSWYGSEYFQDCPPPVGKTLECTIQQEGHTLTGACISLPIDLGQCQALAVRQYTEIGQLRAEVAKLNEVIEQLRRDAERYRGICETNRRNGSGN